LWKVAWYWHRFTQFGYWSFDSNLSRLLLLRKLVKTLNNITGLITLPVTERLGRNQVENRNGFQGRKNYYRRTA
jgi:hypothetical protein